MIFYLQSINSKKKIKKPYSKNEIDLFLFYCIENNYFGMMSMDEAWKKSVTLTVQRKDEVEKTQSGNYKLQFAEDYELEKKI